MAASNARLLIAGLLFASPLTVSAADLLPPAPDLDAPLESPFAGPVEVGTGWYLRGDIGYVEHRRPRDVAYGDPALERLVGAKIGEAGLAGIGLGYKFNAFLRADVTADYRSQARFRATRPDATGFRQDSADFESASALANAYVDLGTWYGITPYAGAGIGFAHTGLSDYRTQRTCVVACPLGPPGTYAATPVPGRSSTALAWALMGGAAIDAGRGLSLDLGYRYMNFGRVRTGLDAADYGTRFKRVDAHELRVGLRWLFADPVASYSPPLSRAF